METHAAGAAPAGLSSAVATTALAGAAKSGGPFFVKLMSMTKTQIAMAGVLAAFAAALIVQSHIHLRQKVAPPEAADISFNFPASPVSQVLSIYAGWAREKLRAPDNINPSAVVHAVTPHQVTRIEALKLLDAALLEQAQITITRAADGTLVAVPKQKINGLSSMRTYLPDGKVDPPFPALGGPMIQPRPPVPNPQH